MITKFNFIADDWKRVKNHCRTTDNKDFTENDASETFRKKLLMSEHSPIRLLEFDWSWKGIAYWVSTEWSRHKFEKFISSQRDDRLIDDTPRGKKPQEAPVNFDGYANMQNLIDAWRKRLCFMATKEARGLAEDFKITLHEDHPLEAAVLVPNCIYRGGILSTCAVTKVTDTNGIRKIRAARFYGCCASVFCSFRWWVPHKYVMFCLDKSSHNIAYLWSPHRSKYLRIAAI